VADTPDDALIEAIAARLVGWQVGWGYDYASLPLDQAQDIARAAYAALVEHLGLTEETQTRCTGCGSTTRNCLMHSAPAEPFTWVRERRLVSQWVKVQP
jgi:hypothetical protein